MKKLYHVVEKELEEIERYGINTDNVMITFFLTGILKNLCFIKKYKGEHHYAGESGMRLDKIGEHFDEYWHKKHKHEDCHEELDELMESLSLFIEMIDERLDEPEDKETIMRHIHLLKEKMEERAK